MNSFNHPVFYALLMLAAGLGIPIMAALNGSLGAKLQSPALATVILFIVGGLSALSFLLITEGIPRFNVETNVPKYSYFGGVFVIFYILTITWVAPKFGVGNAISFVLLGQMIAMSIIDHYGLFSAQQSVMSFQRFMGLIFMLVGVVLVVRRF